MRNEKNKWEKTEKKMKNREENRKKNKNVFIFYLYDEEK